MTDYMSRFGAVTEDGSENVLDYAEIDSRAQMQSHRTGEKPDMTVVFHAKDDVDGSVTPYLQDSEDNETYKDLLSGQTVENPKRGNFALMAMPKKHARYVRAVILESGVAGITAFIEAGAKAEG
jgi:hypothetical protein